MELPDGFDLHRSWTGGFDLDELVRSLAQDLKQRTIRAYGRKHKTPRLVAWYGSASYVYSGYTHAPAAMPAWLARVQRSVEPVAGTTFNSVLANYYRDGADSVAWHADDEPELGDAPTIASLSFGASRVFAIKPRAPKDHHRWRVRLDHGDLLIMHGTSQRDYLHSVPKTSAAVGPRLNLTFRSDAVMD